MEGRTDGSVTISLSNFVGEGIKNTKYTFLLDFLGLILFMSANSSQSFSMFY
jgi:hypothetical protein